ncbi:RpiB/LacA/LacB family sugar-phosphate isomerase [Patescibacteria group bacterium]|nr:RpiB/LacA/LacB family sugar-phosphate isomerase [Patescibacteria group bacterium]MBU1931550.1 RpiB/LacA/LacB family sugar-phosphate isomerase [Patescibacteria group bacterium]
MIFLAADARGFDLKEKIKVWLKDWGQDYQDLGAATIKPGDDFPDYAFPLAEAVVENQALGIVICGTGNGMVMAVNKVKGARGGLGINPEQVAWSKKADFMNILALAVRFTNEVEAKAMVKVFLETDFVNEPRYQRRFDKIKKYEERSLK